MLHGRENDPSLNSGLSSTPEGHQNGEQVQQFIGHSSLNPNILRSRFSRSLVDVPTSDLGASDVTP